ncbi:nucleoside-diphosphate-sugar epimerase family protein [Parathielavia appendiculata]|uniref:Nucleoside-diphosphate-sugar epimerase family protein n=1 Tax=Parathielavia appendiculata TaxID=2587402 RepID=A0AAN6YZM5_9PEZI|nr:nucleoside-diphosphate-sugar epimerase family protein [Parathielavia appendiculata]
MSSTYNRAILVTGATGKQGGALIKVLLAENSGFQILAVTRNSNSPSAQRLAAKSSDITLVQGDFDDTEAMFKAAEQSTSHPIWGAFSVQVPAFNKNGAAIEQRQGQAFVDSAIKHGVKYFVYTSVDRHGDSSIKNPTNVPHFASKHHIEQHLISKAKGTDMAWTILRPVAFMENFAPGLVGKVFPSAWKVMVKSRPLQLVATDDIGVFAAKSFLQPDRFKGQSISLAGDELTFDEMVKVFKQTTGAEPPRTWNWVAKLMLSISEEMGTMYTFFENEGYAANIPELRKVHPELKGLGRWLKETRRMA